MKNASCPFCGMAPLDGEPCCLPKFQRDVMRLADKQIQFLRAERDKARDAAIRECWEIVRPKDQAQDQGLIRERNLLAAALLALLEVRP